MAKSCPSVSIFTSSSLRTHFDLVIKRKRTQQNTTNQKKLFMIIMRMKKYLSMKIDY